MFPEEKTLVAMATAASASSTSAMAAAGVRVGFLRLSEVAELGCLLVVADGVRGGPAVGDEPGGGGGQCRGRRRW